MSLSHEQLVILDKAHLVHPLTPIGSASNVIINRGEGSLLYDINDKPYMDARAQLCCVNLGYSHAGITAAIKKQLEELPFVALFYGFGHPRAIECAARIAAVAPGDLNHVFFSSGGSEGNELAFSFVRQYWAKVTPSKYKIISRYEAYHGNTAAAMTASGMDMAGLPGVPNLVTGHIHMQPPYQYRRGRQLSEDAFAQQCADELANIIECEGADTVAAFIAEPIMGVAGYIAPPQGYWKLIREVCDRYDVLLILDEVMTGFCRTGKMFASETYDIVPDMLVMGKGMTSNYVPCGGVIFNERVFEQVEGSYVTGVTNSGHPLAMAACIAALDAYEDENICENVKVISEYLFARLNDYAVSSAHLSEVSGKGLMIGLEFVKDKTSGEPVGPEVCQGIVSRAVDLGLLVRTRGSRICLSPPLNITHSEVDQICDKLFETLTAEGL